MILVFEKREYTISVGSGDPHPTVRSAALAFAKEMLRRALASDSDSEIQRCYDVYHSVLMGKAEIKFYPADGSPHIVTSVENL